MKPHLALFASITLISPAMAQNAPSHPGPPESITVTGIKDVDAAVTKFVGEMTVPTRLTGKVARWREGICPLAAGLRPEALKLITQRLKDVAAQVGAPINGRASCKPNLEIVFTTTPQVLLDHVQILYPFVLGYHDNSAQAAKLGTITKAIQAWHATATSDLRGGSQLDGAKTGGVNLEMPISPAGSGGGIQTNATPTATMTMPGARIVNVTGSRIGDGVSSDFYHVVVVAEPAKLLDFELGTLADYIALLALSQPQVPETCQELPTMLNLFAKDCPSPPKALTSVDLAFLKALYKMTATTNLNGQRNEIIYQMDKSLGAEK